MHDRRKPRSVLAVGAHPDDVEIGCAGTLLQHRAVGDRATILVMSGGELGAQVEQGRKEEAEKAAASLGAHLVLGSFFDGTIPLTSETVDMVEGLIVEYDVDTVYVHSPEDAHQDHVVTSRAVLAATRKMNRVMFYQSPSTTQFHSPPSPIFRRNFKVPAETSAMLGYCNGNSPNPDQHVLERGENFCDKKI